MRAQLAQEQATQQTKTEVAALVQQVDAYRARLPQEPDPSWLAREIMNLAQRAGVQLKAISQEPLQEIDQSTRLTVNVELAASYHQLGTFLDDVERSERFIRVERLSITPASAGEPAIIQVTFGTLHLPPPVPERVG